jgi:hypothetical protein
MFTKLNTSDVKDLYEKYTYYEKYAYYKSSDFDKKIMSFLETKSSMGEKYIDIINKFPTDVYIIGGVIRDIIIDKKINDVDLSFDLEKDIIINVCNQNNWPCYINDKFSYLKINSDIEAFYSIYKTFKMGGTHYDFSANSLLYDINNKIIIDRTTYGVRDIMNKKIRIPTKYDNFEKWAQIQKNHPLRFFKLIANGFTPINQKTSDFISRYIENNFENIYLKKTINKIPYIQEYIIVSISGGEVFNQDLYIYGNVKKVILYIKAIAQYLNPELVKKIYKIVGVKPYGFKTDFNTYVINSFQPPPFKGRYLYGEAVRNALLNKPVIISEIIYDYTVNTMTYDKIKKTLSSPNESSLRDIITKKIRITVSSFRYEEWAKSNWKYPLNYFKLRSEGFTPSSDEMEKFIVDYIEKNFDSLKIKEYLSTLDNREEYLTYFSEKINQKYVNIIFNNKVLGVGEGVGEDEGSKDTLGISLP